MNNTGKNYVNQLNRSKNDLGYILSEWVSTDYAAFYAFVKKSLPLKYNANLWNVLIRAVSFPPGWPFIQILTETFRNIQQLNSFRSDDETIKKSHEIKL